MKPFEIFRPGRVTAMSGETVEITAADLEATARAYDPAVHEAPFVVGHPKVDAPAYGWAGSIRFAEGGLVVEPKQVEPTFGQLVRDGRFKKVSASFYKPDYPKNPKPGVFYLRHVGFLGAHPPALSGLKPIEFAAADEGCITVEFGAESAVTKEAPVVTITPEELAKQKAELEAREKQISEREMTVSQKEVSFGEREQTLKKKEAEARRSGIVEFVGGLVKAGQVHPKHQNGLVSFMASLDDSGVIEFGEGESAKTAPASGWLREFLGGLQKIVEFGETASDKGDRGTDRAVEFAAPAGCTVDAEALSLHRKAVAFQAKNPGTDYETAVRAVK